MRPLVARTLQLVLRAYPAEFRRSYGDAVLQTVADRHDHEGVSWTRILAPEFLDATRVAPLMRWESPMNRIVIVVLAAAVVGFVAVAVSPATLIPLAVVMIAAVAWWARQNRPFDAQPAGAPLVRMAWGRRRHDRNRLRNTRHRRR